MYRSQGLLFTSNFDSGNLGGVYDDDDGVIHVKINKDPCGFFQLWYHFRVDVDAGESWANKDFSIVIDEIDRASCVFREDLTPMHSVNGGSWHPVPGGALWDVCAENEGALRVEFSIRMIAGESHHFAFCEPYTYAQSQNLGRDLEALGGHSTWLDVTRKSLCRTPGDLSVDMFTFQAKKRTSNQHRAPRRDALIIGRVHPGEAPASYLIAALARALCADEMSCIYQNGMRIHIIPMLNPDGVYHGFYRTNMHGVNLNRSYSSPDPGVTPEVFYLLQKVVPIGCVRFRRACDAGDGPMLCGIFLLTSSTLLAPRVY